MLKKSLPQTKKVAGHLVNVTLYQVHFEAHRFLLVNRDKYPKVLPYEVVAMVMNSSKILNNYVAYERDWTIANRELKNKHSRLITSLVKEAAQKLVKNPRANIGLDPVSQGRAEGFPALEEALKAKSEISHILGKSMSWDDIITYVKKSKVPTIDRV